MTYEGKTERFVLATLEATRSAADYVAVEDGSIWTREDLWLQVLAVVREAAEESKVVKGPGRPPRGPGSQMIDTDESTRLRMVANAYDEITKAKRRPAFRNEIADSLACSTTTLWRLCRGRSWPPTTWFP